MSTETRPTLLIVIASSRPGRQGDAWGAWIAETARRHGAFRVRTVDLAELRLPFFDEPHHPRMRRYTKDHTKVWSQMVDSADAFVFVTPEYNFSFNAVLKNALDYLFQEWNDKAAGILSYGGASGGMRAAQMLKMVLGALGMVVPANSVAVSGSRDLLDDRGHVSADEKLRGQADAMLTELARLEKALAPARAELKASAAKAAKARDEADAKGKADKDAKDKADKDAKKG